jgi:DNA mismatch repair protein MutL
MQQNHDDSPREIKRLSDALINQIKAGEVVEKPSALIKEILENSLDAGATLCELNIQKEGLALIELKDNGKGMGLHDLAHAFERHATSKLVEFNDLYHLSTYGFRGEALASIASVSRIECRSRQGRIVLEGGVVNVHEQTAHFTEGTHLFIKDLFFNTPVRLHFLRNGTKELKDIKKIIISFLLSYPHIQLQLKIDTHVERFPAFQKHFERTTKSLLFRLQQVIKRQEEWQTFDVEYEGRRLLGAVGTHALTAQSAQQFLFVNSRYIEDRRLHAIIQQSFKEEWGPGKTGHYTFFIDVPPEGLDVNVHPNKTQVKFSHPEKVYALLSAALRKAPQAAEKNHEKRQNELEESDPSATSHLSSFSLHMPRFAVIPLNEKLFLEDQLALVIHYHHIIVQQNGPFLNEDHYLPLLISYPLPEFFPKEDSFRSLGFITDQAGITATLTDLHKLSLSDYLPLMIQAWIAFAEQDLPVNSFFDFFIRQNLNYPHLPPYERNFLLEKIKQNSPHVLEKITRPLDTQSMLEFFYGAGKQ